MEHARHCRGTAWKGKEGSALGLNGAPEPRARGGGPRWGSSGQSRLSGLALCKLLTALRKQLWNTGWAPLQLCPQSFPPPPHFKTFFASLFQQPCNYAQFYRYCFKPDTNTSIRCWTQNQLKKKKWGDGKYLFCYEVHPTSMENCSQNFSVLWNHLGHETFTKSLLKVFPDSPFFFFF